MLNKLFPSHRSKVKLFYYIDCFFPKRKNKILFVVKNRTYFSGNLRILLETYLAKDTGILYIYKDGELSLKLKDELENLGVVVLFGFTLHTIWHILTSGTIILSHNPRDAHLSKKSKQRKIINLWHGVALKQIELLMPNIEKEKLELLNNNSTLYTMLIASSHQDKTTNISAFGVAENKVKVTGLPRYEILKPNYSLGTVLQEEENDITRIKKGRKLILFAPTFRENNTSAIEQINNNEWRKIHNFAKTSNILFGIRPHPYDVQSLPKPIQNSIHFHLFDSHTYTEANLLLKHTDILVVDFSSIWVDYLLLHRPVIGFAKDYHTYLTKERGFIYDFKETFPSNFNTHIEDFISATIDALAKEKPIIYIKALNIFHKYSLHDNYAKMVYDAIESTEKNANIYYSSSTKLIKNTKYFLDIKKYVFFSKPNLKSIFIGWGQKRSGQKAKKLSKKYNVPYILLEDGFIRSIGLGINGSASFSLVEDDTGIYYDATTPSKLENILNTYDFSSDKELILTTKRAIALIKKYHISKYNNAPDVEKNFFKEDKKPKVLVVAQTAGDASLVYGLGTLFSTQQIIEDAIKENPNASVYIKIHPDVLTGKKSSDIKINEIPPGCIVLDKDMNPISLLKNFDKVYTKTSGMGMEALILGLEVVCYGMPYYAGWGVTIDKQHCERRKKVLTVEEIFSASSVLYTRYYNPYSQKESNIIDTIQTIVKYRELMHRNDGDLYFFGFSRWKRKNTIPFFSSLEKSTISFYTSLEDAKKKGLHSKSKIYIWGKKSFNEIETYAKEQNIPLLRVEDGFVRSVSLGSDLTKAYSLVVDSRGIYFDPTQESDLEYLLNTYHFDTILLERSQKLQKYLIANKISKYNSDKDKNLILKDYHKSQRVIMVPGQVEDDASIIYGANGMSNLALLQYARKNASDAYIIYKPHPDVLAGNRKGNVSTDQALRYCDTIITKASLDSVLELSDEVHTMTSLVGYEALIRGKKVTTYGVPFYAGWGLTVDMLCCKRRTRKISLDMLVAATMILYPRYINPKTNQLCEVEVLLAEIDKEKSRYNNNTKYRYFLNSRNWLSRKIQFLIKVVLGE